MSAFRSPLYKSALPKQFNKLMINKPEYLTRNVDRYIKNVGMGKYVEFARFPALCDGAVDYADHGGGLRCFIHKT